jgi:hypothetical protein
MWASPFCLCCISFMLSGPSRFRSAGLFYDYHMFRSCNRRVFTTLSYVIIPQGPEERRNLLVTWVRFCLNSPLASQDENKAQQSVHHDLWRVPHGISSQLRTWGCHVVSFIWRKLMSAVGQDFLTHPHHHPPTVESQLLNVSQHTAVKDPLNYEC